MNTVSTSPEVSQEAAQEKAARFASQLRQMATWLEEHPYAATALMGASIGFNQGPVVSLYRAAILKQAFPGHDATKQEVGTSEVHRLTRDGIRFESWETPQPKVPETERVTL